MRWWLGAGFLNTSLSITRRALIGSAVVSAAPLRLPAALAAARRQLAYFAPDLGLRFWRILAKGAEDEAAQRSASVSVYDSSNDPAMQAQNVADAIERKIDGILLSPTDSAAAPQVLEAAAEAGIPVVIADIGTSHGEYVSFINSDNFHGAYGVGQVLARAIQKRGFDHCTVGVVAISLTRNNGQERTNGFMKAMDEAGIGQAELAEMQRYTAAETYDFVRDMVNAHPDMHGVFVETDQASLGALRALRITGRQRSVLVAAFDGVPDFVPLIADGVMVGSGMQQPYLMGQLAARAMLDYLDGKIPERQITVPILVVTAENIREMEPIIRTTVFGA